MNIRTIITASIVSAACAGMANAADLGRGGSKDDGYEYAGTGASFSNGFYMTLGVGGSFVKSGKDVSTTTDIPVTVGPYRFTSEADSGTYTAYIADQDGTIKGKGLSYEDAASACLKANASAPTCVGVAKGSDSKATYKAVTVKYDATTQTVSGSAVATKTTVSKAHYGLSGVIADARIGYDFGFGNGWFAGPYAGLGYDWASSGDLSQGFAYEAGGRIGKQFGNARIFAELGYRGEHAAMTKTFSEDLQGILVGGGAEVSITKNFGIGARVDYVSYGSFTADDGYSVNMNQIIGVGYASVRF